MTSAIFYEPAVLASPHDYNAYAVYNTHTFSISQFILTLLFLLEDISMLVQTVERLNSIQAVSLL